MQPKEGGSQGGETRENVVYRLAEDMLEKLPKQYNSFEVKEALHRMGALLPMNIFLRQEIDRIQRVIKEVCSSLIGYERAFYVLISHLKYWSNTPSGSKSLKLFRAHNN